MDKDSLDLQDNKELDIQDMVMELLQVGYMDLQLLLPLAFVDVAVAVVVVDLEWPYIVGEYFGAGKMFLPQVVKSSRIMKEIVDKLQDKFEQSDDSKKLGTVILATVKGDVHDIGKNILSLILTCNNFKVIDLGVMVNSSDILESAREYNADIIALSGLITPSLEEMQKVAERMEKEGFKLPALMVGGATTSKKHTAIKIAPNYHGLVVHTTNASEAAVVAQKIVLKDEDFISQIRKEQAKILKEYKK